MGGGGLSADAPPSGRETQEQNQVSECWRVQKHTADCSSSPPGPGCRRERKGNLREPQGKKPGRGRGKAQGGKWTRGAQVQLRAHRRDCTPFTLSVCGGGRGIRPRAASPLHPAHCAITMADAGQRPFLHALARVGNAYPEEQGWGPPPPTFSS